MEPIPALRVGWFNGWILVGLLYGIYAILLLIFPKAVREAFMRIIGPTGVKRKESVIL